MSEKKPQCLTCKHNARVTSCGPCADKGAMILEGISEATGVDVKSTADDDVHGLKLGCKILIRYPEDFDIVDPYNCRYYMSSFFSFR